MGWLRQQTEWKGQTLATIWQLFTSGHMIRPLLTRPHHQQPFPETISTLLFKLSKLFKFTRGQWIYGATKLCTTICFLKWKQTASNHILYECESIETFLSWALYIFYGITRAWTNFRLNGLQSRTAIIVKWGGKLNNSSSQFVEK